MKSLKDKLYYLKCLLFKRYNVLKIKTLPPTWMDEDYLLVHANFAVLEYFMSGPGIKDINWECDNEHRQLWKELNEIRDWWNHRSYRESLESEANRQWYDHQETPKEKELLDKSRHLQSKHLQEEEDMLIRLIKIRHSLWT